MSHDKSRVMLRRPLTAALLAVLSAGVFAQEQQGQVDSDPAAAQPASQEEAQEAVGEEQGATTLDAVSVTGYQAANEAVVNAKYTNQNISDSVGTDEIGSVPDFNLAESMQRVAGVSTAQDNGEDRFTIVRGFKPDYNFTTIDGLVLPSTDNASRSVLFDIIPSSVVKRVDIVKSFSADIDGQAIGGNIALVTRSAFDKDGVFFVANGAGGIMEHTDQGADDVDPSARLDMTFSNTFGDRDQFGVVIAGNYWKRDTYALSPTVSGTTPYYFYDADGTKLGSNAPGTQPEDIAAMVPENSAMYVYHSDRSRRGGVGKFEYRSEDDDFHAHIQAFRFERVDNERRDHQRLRNRDGSITPLQLTPTSGLVVGASEAAAEVLEQTFEDSMQGAQAGFDYRFGDRHLLEATLGYSEASLDNPGLASLYHIPKSEDQGFSYELGKDGVPLATPTNPEIFGGPEHYQMYRTQYDWKRNAEEVSEGRLDYSFNLDPSAIGWGFKAGGKLRRFERVRDNDRAEYRPVEGSTLFMDSVVSDHSYMSDAFSVPMMFINLNALQSLYDLDDPSAFSLRSSSAEASITSDYRISEDVDALYGMGVWGGDNYRLRAGLRYESTKVAASAQQSVDGEFVPFSTSSSYDNWLPRADATFDVTENFRIRAAYSRSLGRPNYEDLAPYRSVNFDPDLSRVVISGGNPELQPRESENFDLSFEYYIPGGGLVALGLFHKELDNEIYELRTLQEGIEYEGETVDLLTVQPENAESASLSGVEIGVIKSSLDFLPGWLSNFGVSANFAYIDSQAELVVGNDEATGEVTTRELYGLFLQPKRTANASLFYNQGPFEGRLAYNYKSGHLKSIASFDHPWADRLYDDRTRLDLQVRYWLSDHWRLFAEAKNLTGSYAHEINALGLHHTRRDSGRSYWFGATYKF